MEKIIQSVKNHKWAFLFAFLVGAIMVFPQIYFQYDHSQEYQGIYISGTDNESFYLNRVAEVRDGHPSLGSPIFKEGKDNPYLQPPLGEIIIAYLGRIFFLDFNNTILLTKFLFPFLGFLIVYGFVFLISKEKLTALTSSTVLILANSLFSRHGLLVLLQGESPATAFLNFFRPVQPQMNFLFFFGFLLCFWLFFEKKQWRWGIISSLILGLSFYIYLYTWSFLYVFVGLILLIFLLKRQWSEIRRIGYVVLGSLLVTIPYFLNLYRSILHPNFSEVSPRFGLIDGRQPILGFLVPIIFILFVLFFPKKRQNRYLFSLALLLTPFIVLNQQLITNRIFETGHYHWYTNQPLAIIFFIIILFYQTGIIQERWRVLKTINILKILAVLIIGISLYTGITIQTASYKEQQDGILQDQKYAPIIKWLNAYTQKDEVVLADWILARVIPSYTSLNVFDGTSGYYYLAASRQRMSDIIFLFHRLDGLKGEEAKNRFLEAETRVSISRGLYGEYYKEKFGDEVKIPDEILLDLAKKYQDSLLIPLDKFLKIHDVKYVVWDKKDYPQWQMDQYKFLDPVYEEGNFKIYILQ